MASRKLQVGVLKGEKLQFTRTIRKAHLRCFPLLRSSFLLIKWRSLRGFLYTDSHASMESAYKKPQVNWNKNIVERDELLGLSCSFFVVYCIK